jgi:hypothetical protein
MTIVNLDLCNLEISNSSKIFIFTCDSSITNINPLINISLEISVIPFFVVINNVYNDTLQDINSGHVYVLNNNKESKYDKTVTHNIDTKRVYKDSGNIVGLFKQ